MTPEQFQYALQKMAQKHPHRRLADAIDKARAEAKVNQLRAEIGHQQRRTPAQKEMLAGIPPITAFMGMEG